MYIFPKIFLITQLRVIFLFIVKIRKTLKSEKYNFYNNEINTSENKSKSIWKIRNKEIL